MTSADVTIEGEVERVTYENADTGFRVLKVSVAGAQGSAHRGRAPAPSSAGLSRARARGTMIVDARHGEQLKAEHATELAAQHVDRAREVPRVGAGSRDWTNVRGAHRRDLRGWTRSRCSTRARSGCRRSAGWGRSGSRRSPGRGESSAGCARCCGVPPGARRAAGARGEDLQALRRRDGGGGCRGAPYLLALDVWGVGFRTADRLARELGVGLDSPERMEGSAVPGGARHDGGRARVGRRGRAMHAGSGAARAPGTGRAARRRAARGSSSERWAAWPRPGWWCWRRSRRTAERASRSRPRCTPRRCA